MKLLKEKKEKKVKEAKPLTPAERKRKKRLKKIMKFVSAFLVVALIAGGVGFFLKKNNSSAVSVNYESVNVEKRTLSSTITGSGSLEPISTYDITTSVRGEIVAADFEVGDYVEEGQVLYQFTTDEVESDIADAEKSLERAQKSYDKTLTSYDSAEDKVTAAQETYEEALSDYNEALETYNETAALYDNFNITSEVSGSVTAVYVEVGDTVKEGDRIADVSDSSKMLLVVPFNASDVKDSWVGETAEVEILGSYEMLTGIVTKVNAATSVLDGNQIVRMVTIEVDNPGSITTSYSGMASIGNVTCNSEGSFTTSEQTTILATKAGDISTVNIEKDGSVSAGDAVVTLNAANLDDYLESVTTSLENAQTKVDNALDSIESAKSSLTDAQDSIDDAKETLEDAEDAYQDELDLMEDCYILSPVSGKVIKKNIDVGDTLSVTNFTVTMAVIYDVSAMTFEMSIDELDISQIYLGQEVQVTADAMDGQTFTGSVSYISYEATTSGGVSTYPVTVQIDEVGDLYTSMNVDATIVLTDADNVLTVPVDAIQRNNYVYVKDDTVTEAVGSVPAGFRAVEVETGVNDGNYVEIVSGLEEGDVVYVVRYTSATEDSENSLLDGLGSLGDFGSDSSSGTSSSGNWQGGGSMPSGGSSSGGGMPSGGGPGF